MSIAGYESLCETMEIEVDKALMKRLKKPQRNIAAGKAESLYGQGSSVAYGELFVRR